MVAESTRRFTKNLLKHGSAAEIRQTACNAVKHSAMMLGKAHCFSKEGDVVIVLTGWRPGSGYTNTMRVVLVP